MTINKTISDLITSSDLEAMINIKYQEIYGPELAPEFISTTVENVIAHPLSENEAITTNAAPVANIFVNAIYQYNASLQDFNIDTKREELIQSINKLTTKGSQKTGSNSNSTESSEGITQAYIQNQSQTSDTEWNNNKFRDNAVNATTDATNYTTNSATADTSSDTTQTTNPAVIRFTRELRNLNVFASKMWQNLLRRIVLDLSQPFETEGRIRRGLPPYFTYE